MAQFSSGFLTLLRGKCSPYNANGKFHHGEAKVLGDIQAADFKVVQPELDTKDLLRNLAQVIASGLQGARAGSCVMSPPILLLSTERRILC